MRYQPHVRPDTATVVAFLLISVFGGMNSIAVKVAVHDLAPFWSAALRFLVAGGLLAAFVVATGRRFPRGRSVRGAVGYGAVAFAGSYALLHLALRDANAATAAIFLALVPLETFGLAILQRQERYRGGGIVGGVMALAGVALIVSVRVEAGVPATAFALLIGATLFIAQGAVLLKRIPRADPFGTNAVAMLTGGGLLLGVSALAGEPWTAPGSEAAWLAMAHLVFLGSIGLFGLYAFAIGRWTASGVSHVNLLMPVVGVPLAAILLGEQVSAQVVVGGAIAIVGTYLGAFAAYRPQRSTAISSPECLAIDDCPVVLPTPAAARQPAGST